MKAARLHAFGQPLVIEDVPEPEPEPGEVLFRVRYAGVKPVDVWLTGFTAAAISAVQPFGRIVLYGASAGGRAEIDLRMLYRNSIQLLTFSGTIELDDRNRRALSEALQAVARGELRVPIDEVLPLERVNEAHTRIRDRRVKGKLLLAP